MIDSDSQARVFISVGSNIEPAGNILRAFDLLKEKFRIVAVSTFYRTEPIGKPEQASFVNGVWCIETAMDPRALKFEVLRAIETQLGRQRSDDKYADRTIDLDILLYGDRVVDEPDLKIPDPDIRRRPFLLFALVELAAELVFPDTGEPLISVVKPYVGTGLVPEADLTISLMARWENG